MRKDGMPVNRPHPAEGVISWPFVTFLSFLSLHSTEVWAHTVSAVTGCMPSKYGGRVPPRPGVDAVGAIPPQETLRHPYRHKEAHLESCRVTPAHRRSKSRPDSASDENSQVLIRMGRSQEPRSRVAFRFGLLLPGVLAPRQLSSRGRPSRPGIISVSLRSWKHPEHFGRRPHEHHRFLSPP